MNSNIANPKALGFGVFAIALWMFSLAHAGLIHPMRIDPATMNQVMTLATLGLLIAGIMAFLRREGWLAFFFLLWAGLAWGSSHGVGHAGGMGPGDTRFDAWFAIAITLVNLYLWFAAIKSRKLGGAVSFTLLLLWISMLFMGLQAFIHGAWVLGRISGAVGLAAAVVAFYVSAGTLAHDHCPNMNLPCIPKNDNVV
ncbi:MAG: hypothetical protein ACRETC_11285 [Gammaproteobacteria bacterium]